jgi:hypothetical protein
MEDTNNRCLFLIKLLRVAKISHSTAAQAFVCYETKCRHFSEVRLMAEIQIITFAFLIQLNLKSKGRFVPVS